MSIRYVISSFEDEAEQISIELLTQQLKESWSDNKISIRTDSPISPLEWDLTVKEKSLTGEVLGHESALAISGDLTLIAEFVLWYRDQMVGNADLYMYDTGYLYGQIPLDRDTTVENIETFFT